MVWRANHIFQRHFQGKARTRCLFLIEDSLDPLRGSKLQTGPMSGVRRSAILWVVVPEASGDLFTDLLSCLTIVIKPIIELITATIRSVAILITNTNLYFWLPNKRSDILFAHLVVDGDDDKDDDDDDDDDYDDDDDDDDYDDDDDDDYDDDDDDDDDDNDDDGDEDDLIFVFIQTT